METDRKRKKARGKRICKHITWNLFDSKQFSKFANKIENIFYSKQFRFDKNKQGDRMHDDAWSHDDIEK
jgi:hypothetical protein